VKRGVVKYIICGFSGSGKSSVLKQLQDVASLRSFRFIDLDDYLLENVAVDHTELGKYITDVGWEEFRRQENIAVSELLRGDSVVVALGGGTLNPDLVNKLKSMQECEVFWLDVPFETCWERIKDDENRPLRLQGKEKCESVYKERTTYFKQFKSFKCGDSIADYLSK
jgi:shikimate kinase